MENNENNENSIEIDPDFVYAPRKGNSLKEVLKSAPYTDAEIAVFLGTTEKKVKKAYKEIVLKLRDSLDVEI